MSLFLIVEDLVYHIIQIDIRHQVPSNVIQILDMFIKHGLFFFIAFNGDNIGGRRND